MAKKPRWVAKTIQIDISASMSEKLDRIALNRKRKTESLVREVLSRYIKRYERNDKPEEINLPRSE